MNADCLFFAAVGAAYGVLLGWWLRGRAERRRNAPAAMGPLLEVLGEHARATPEEWRRARLAYDTIYDERHPEEWA